MKNTNFEIYNLEKHQTKDIHDEHTNGSLTVIFRDYDQIIKNQINMIYVSSVNPKEIKGPHLHKQRNSYFACIHGKVIFVIQNKLNEYIEVKVDSENPKIIKIPKGIASAHFNPTDQVARVLVLADISWKPNDNEMENISFENYDWKKWF